MARLREHTTSDPEQRPLQSHPDGRRSLGQERAVRRVAPGGVGSGAFLVDQVGAAGAPAEGVGPGASWQRPHGRRATHHGRCSTPSGDAEAARERRKVEQVVDVGMQGTRALAAHTDWSTTPTGAADQWPPALLAAWDLALDSTGADRPARRPAQRAALQRRVRRGTGNRHPAAFACPAATRSPSCWRESHLGGLLDRVLTDGDPFLDPDSRVGLRPEGLPTEPSVALLGHHLRTASAVRDEVGDVVAVVHVVVGDLVHARPGAGRRRAGDRAWAPR